MENNMKQFNLQEYLANPNRQVITREGKKVRIICTDAKCDHPIVALVEGRFSDYESIGRYTKDGRYYANETTMSDLFFTPEKHERWVNLYKEDDNIYASMDTFKTKEEAEALSCSSCIATVKVEWEE